MTKLRKTTNAHQLLDSVTIGMQDLEANFDDLKSAFKNVRHDIKWLKNLMKYIDKELENVELEE